MLRIPSSGSVVNVLGRSAKKLAESKHLLTHDGIPEREELIQAHHSRNPLVKDEKESKKSVKAAMAFAALAVLIAGTNKKLLAHLFFIWKASKVVKSTPDARSVRIKIEAEMAAASRVLSDAFKKSYVLGIQSSGLPRRLSTANTLSVAEARWLHIAVKQEIRYLNKLFSDVRTVKSVGIFLPRIKLYADGLAGIYTAGQVMSTSKDTLIHWDLSPTALHCNDCLELASASPYTKETLPTQPKCGWCQCLSNCKCSLRYESVDSITAARVRNASKPKTYWTAKLRGLQRR